MKRFEYKYALSGVTLDSVINEIKFHPAGFSEAYPQRQVNNFYLDTLSYNLFYQNIDGVSNRRKFRYRWYNSYDLNAKANLEIKHKENELGWKDIIPIQLSEIATQDGLIKHFESTSLSPHYFEPKLYNQYQRLYFISNDGRFRVTIDYDQRFGLPYSSGQYYDIRHKDDTIIVELKFDETEFDHLEEINNYLPYLRTKNSKYSTGIQHLNNREV